MKHPAQEPDIVPTGLITLVIGVVIVAMGIGVLVMWGIARFRTEQLRGDPTELAEQRLGVPREVNAMEMVPFTEEAQGLASHALGEKVLNSYGWVDEQRQIVHVPIGVAFDLYLARHHAGTPPVARRRKP
ncbi:MAG TPA: hypothetical protein VFS15_06045 [Kofleriaceae bacterium]|nr:hypothetical protein [Kofleriaceae bacterium]